MLYKIAFIGRGYSRIRQNIESYLRDRSWSISQFAQIAGVNSGALSRTLNGNKSLSMMELNRITAALGLPEP
ncbi:helix-turn-helix domain-containing protein [Paenibacillus campinasensis]|uniref:Helix-turn-helix domain-containing protein n=1 Tax=Paenibacillus campinasensis TaxID=66347 RepID=A0ABW9SYV0_9BACL|nr:helix-turn-helix domain-containing protein [Paenibacillus campinasensis]